MSSVARGRESRTLFEGGRTSKLVGTVLQRTPRKHSGRTQLSPPTVRASAHVLAPHCKPRTSDKSCLARVSDSTTAHICIAWSLRRLAANGERGVRARVLLQQEDRGGCLGEAGGGEVEGQRPRRAVGLPPSRQRPSAQALAGASGAAQRQVPHSVAVVQPRDVRAPGKGPRLVSSDDAGQRTRRVSPCATSTAADAAARARIVFPSRCNYVLSLDLFLWVDP
eukprot:scaffold5807_cov412-Prasinococcus_capsulatus_cf.AAC.11